MAGRPEEIAAPGRTTLSGGRAFVVLAALGALLLPAPQQARAAVPRFEPVSHNDARDVTSGPLDIVSATFGQHDTRLTLRIRTAVPWNANELAAQPGRLLCLALYANGQATPHARICVMPSDGASTLRYTRLDPAGNILEDRPLPATVERPDKRTLVADFTPLAAGLARGRFAWQLQSAWTDGAACTAASPCIDRVPDRRLVHDTVRLLALPRCFGAAARDPRRRCSNPALRTAVIPTPAAARRARNARCEHDGRVGLLGVCAFGVDPSQASSTMALIGDSHAQHWRGALEVVAQAKRWRGLSITRSGCPFTTASPILPGRVRSARCKLWNVQLRTWFTQHPEVHTVFVSSHAGAKTSDSRDAGYRAALLSLPPSVTRVFLFRDTPYFKPYSGCVNRAVAHHHRPGPSCAQRRARSLLPDPYAAVAYSLHSARVHVIDMTHFFCDARSCYPVVGGALVLKEGGHLTSVFASTLGPFVLRAIG